MYIKKIRKMKNIRDLTIEELENIIIQNGEKKYRAKQIFNWLHKKCVCNLNEMSNIPKRLIAYFEENFDCDMPIIYSEFVSNIDETKKYIIKLNDNNYIETVLMKYKFGYSICISSEVGCDMQCIFCASTIGGMKRNLHTYELLSQIYLIENKNNIKISHIVIMGSGEPLLNFDNIIKFLEIINNNEGQNISFRHITISTCGIVPNIDKLSSFSLPINLAISLHAPTDVIRKKIMPIANKYNLKTLLASCKNYFQKTKRRLTFEYILIKNINSSYDDCKKLINLFDISFNKTVDFVVNLIPVNDINDKQNIKLLKPTIDEIKKFKGTLEKHGVATTVRRELGADISGSCGQLRAGMIK